MDEQERQHWLEGLAQFDKENELIALGVMCAFGKPQSWLDVGCGTGAVVNTAHRLGIDAFGIDQMQTLSDRFAPVDLRNKIYLGRTFELVYSVEVAEHIEETYEGEFCDTLVRHVAEGGRLILTAAPPGQDGYNHFNCQTKKYWRDRMESRGLVYHAADTERLAAIWKQSFTSLMHLSKNLQVFKRATR